MAQSILHHNGVYNIYCSISDGIIFNRGVTKNELIAFLRDDAVQRFYQELPRRFERAEERGTSSMVDRSLESTVSCNRCGPDGKKMPLKQILEKYLTIPAGTVVDDDDLIKEGREAAMELSQWRSPFEALEAGKLIDRLVEALEKAQDELAKRPSGEPFAWMNVHNVRRVKQADGVLAQTAFDYRLCYSRTDIHTVPLYLGEDTAEK